MVHTGTRETTDYLGNQKTSRSSPAFCVSLWERQATVIFCTHRQAKQVINKWIKYFKLVTMLFMIVGFADNKWLKKCNCNKLKHALKSITYFHYSRKKNQVNWLKMKRVLGPYIFLSFSVLLYACIDIITYTNVLNWESFLGKAIDTCNHFMTSSMHASH